MIHGNVLPVFSVKKKHDPHWIKSILFFLPEFYYYRSDAIFIFCHKQQRQYFFSIEKERSLQFYVEQAWFSRAGAKYFSQVKMIVASFEFYRRGELGRERQLQQDSERRLKRSREGGDGDQVLNKSLFSFSKLKRSSWNKFSAREVCQI